ncbi:pyrroline-5-carboxylate reductase 3-like [Pollicipes pollicipes]|uniref:pyrroline-5-carboxylate reductase 3-like n=1 Tax=Pollicipes pollicipes TaxID=41117 RepID=UPI0018849F1C|nr:pyrroline-5-carboxylate reductase 3-like [Pollicipes pollicipes]XP_037070670.1 pyrroline-5-carboxylate reductase 3-like [Pollicipes pollicipes]XP_037070743.1 pyrroline-5-carboxylate reductase 3-like [Pollicipes pollicipes]XP_037070818.1 pyrroline-5-carboxylate reductase 3-like [Pollicipes pollicipes]XP_037070891.1 pyrroline-5-carboxylate reductase 3-like [Pollicipes pollicipes]XP_037070965.1 pyrroline-5-carboxylate reductase 3-like [Pollicipes pollicipes]XP_037071036.1 pyrroline-5-carboxyl
MAELPAPTELLVQVQKDPNREGETVIQVVRHAEGPRPTDDEDDTGGEEPVAREPTESSKKIYLQRYRSAWEEVPAFRDWLMPVPDDPFSAACASCECSMKAHRQLLIEHCKSKKHQRQLGHRNPLYTPGPAARRGKKRAPASSPTPYRRIMKQLKPERDELEVSYNDSSRVTYAIGLGAQRVGFIGSGSVARAIAKGMLDKGLVVPAKVMVSAPSDRNFETWKKWGCRTTISNDSVIRTCEIVFLAVKASVLEPLVAELGVIGEDKSRCFISLVSGVSRERVAALLAGRRELQTEMAELHVVRCQPSTPLMIGEGCCSYSAAADLPHHWLLAVETIFSALGMCYKVEEGLMDALAGAFSSGPAFAYSFVEALAAGAVNMGVPWHLARPMAAQTVLGAARMLMETGCTASELRDEASPPGGTTSAGLMTLEKEGLKYAVMAAVRAATERSRQLGRDEGLAGDPLQ